MKDCCTCCKNKCDEYITHDLCIDIKQKCDTNKKYWESHGVDVNGTLKIKNLSCHYMKVLVERKGCDVVEFIEPKRELLLTITNMNSIQIKCICCCGEDECRGCIQMMIHLPCNVCEKTNRTCNDC